MSGGRPSQTADSGGGSPILHKQCAEGWGDRWSAPEDQTKGLVLTEDGVADPKKKEGLSARQG